MKYDWINYNKKDEINIIESSNNLKKKSNQTV